ncbi:MAG: ATP-dependent DNA helicase RecG, partial [Pedobacter sp.]|jgi:ATP-dependent DNA helicase RecG
LSKFFEDPLPKEIIEEYQLMNFNDAIAQVHFPESDELLDAARHRLGFQELLLIQLRVLNRKKLWREMAENRKESLVMDKKCVQSFLDRLPYKLTGAQTRSLNEILIDMSGSLPMSRLLEGDVGSGKTVVAAAAAYMALMSGHQVLMMVPTEILAKQHFETMYGYLKDCGFNIQLLVGSLTKTQKEQLVNDLKNGVIDFVIGTHAIIQDNVHFRNLGLAIIDEQHRFGVSQRAFIKQFGTPHTLSMTATPIPRTLALTLYGDQDLSIIDEMPPGRQEIITRVVPENKRDGAYEWIKDQVLKGRQAFIVCPLIEESEVLEVKSAVNEYERLSHEVFSEFKLGLLHGRLKQSEKDEIMELFSLKKINILVSTTVIEVGIDVPNATIMVVEAADRFGLAQLHQLRGRVGRGEFQSYCFLFLEGDSEIVRQRMSAMVENSDGFKLAEIDLSLRGPGEVYGIRQSGIPDLKMASLSDRKLVQVAREAAEKIMALNLRLDAFFELSRYIDAEEVVIDY